MEILSDGEKETVTEDDDYTDMQNGILQNLRKINSSEKVHGQLSTRRIYDTGVAPFVRGVFLREPISYLRMEFYYS